MEDATVLLLIKLKGDDLESNKIETQWDNLIAQSFKAQAA